jgi:phosphate transport system substrate-binding protein
MKRIFFIPIVVFFILIFSCKENIKNQNDETIIKGKVTVLVDETILPVIEDQVDVFGSQYDADVKLIAKSESEIVQLLSEGKQNLAILSRELTPNESKFFVEKKIKPRITPLALDAIAFITNKSNKDTIINVKEVIDFMKGNLKIKFKGLVFDNPNSSTVGYLKKIANIKVLPKEKIFSFKSNNEVIEFISKNDGMIGIVGVNWLMQPSSKMKPIVESVKILGINSSKQKSAIKPTQHNIANGIYPFSRQVKMLNYQGFSGLGMGFASFIGGEIGQRIVLKSGLVPVYMPQRNIIIRNKINK